MDHSNPAFRLLKILEEGKDIQRETRCKQVWASILKTNENSPELLIRMGKVMELPSLIVTALQDTYPEEPNTWTHWQTQILNAFSAQQLNGQWGSFIANIDTHSFTYLRIHAKLLQVQSQSKPLNEDLLEKTRSNLNDCLSELMKSDVDNAVKGYIARNLRKLIAAIDEYHITGSTGIFDSIEITMGHQVFDHKYRDFIKDSTLGQKITNILGTLADAMAISQGLPQIGGAIAFFLSNSAN